VVTGQATSARELIEQGNRSWPDMPCPSGRTWSDHGFPHGYQTVKSLCWQPARIGVATSREDHPHRCLRRGHILKCRPRSWRIEWPAKQWAPRRKPARKPRP